MAGLVTFALVAVAHALRVARLDRGHAPRCPSLAFLLRAPPPPWRRRRAVAAALIVWKHRANLRRIAAGTERRLGARRDGAP